MASVLWRTLLNASLAANTKLPEAHFMQLATIKLDGRPANRTVLFRLAPDRLVALSTDLEASFLTRTKC